MTLNKLILDELVQGHDSDSETWQLLLKDSEREEMWDAAVKRREQLNRFCLFAVKWPSLAKTYKQLSTSIKKSIHSPKLKLFEGIPSNAPLVATLSKQGSAMDSTGLLAVNITWGEQKIIELDVEKEIKFFSENELPIYYLYSESVGWMTTNDSWHFHPAEGAVILTFIDGHKSEQGDLCSASKQAKSISTIVLLPK
jgi:hypothetical protein